MSRVAYDEIDVNGVMYTVSTINRQSSCMYGGRYAETMVFRGGITGKLIWQGGASEGSTRTHDRALSALRNGEELES